MDSFNLYSRVYRLFAIVVYHTAVFASLYWIDSAQTVPKARLGYIVIK